MRITMPQLSNHVRGALSIFAALAFFLAAAHPASAQGWRTADAKNAWNAFDTAFYNTDSGGRGYYYHSQTCCTEEGFWTYAEEIEMAIDHYSWSLTNDSANSTTYKDQVLDLINGFRNQHGDCGSPTSCSWTSDPGDDDLGVAELAFVRCYEITGSSICLSDAENSFQAVYARGWDTTFKGGGLWWDVATKNYKSSSANWSNVIAGYLLYKATGTTLYKTDADNIYNWAKSNLEESSTGQVYDGWSTTTGLNTGLVSYNFGLAAGAAYMENDATNSNAIGTYLIANVHQDTIDGYNILPNYGQSNTNGFGAFNGMTFRWTAVASEASGGMPSNFVAWADANLNQGWAVRNPNAMTWDDWIPDPPASHSPTTPTTGLYSIDCTPMLVGMWWFAPTAQ